MYQFKWTTRDSVVSIKEKISISFHYFLVGKEDYYKVIEFETNRSFSFMNDPNEMMKTNQNVLLFAIAKDKHIKLVSLNPTKFERERTNV